MERDRGSDCIAGGCKVAANVEPSKVKLSQLIFLSFRCSLHYYVRLVRYAFSVNALRSSADE